jgi:predicted NAD/FAD-binding protein
LEKANASHLQLPLIGEDAPAQAQTYSLRVTPESTPTQKSPNEGTARAKVAVIGSGVSGLTAAYILQRTCDVTLIEADFRLGGHAHTHELIDPKDGRKTYVDSGFIVHNQTNYPTLVRLFKELEIRTQPTQMSLSISCGGCGLEYAGGAGAKAIFAQYRRLVDLRFLKMLLDIRRFHRIARSIMAENQSIELPLGEFLADNKFSTYFVQHFMVPLISSVWSCSQSEAMSYPALYLFAFLDNHAMLSVTGSPKWRTVVDGSQIYVSRITAHLSRIRQGQPVISVKRGDGAIEIGYASGEVETFDKVVIATHADQALQMLVDQTPNEQAVLSAFTYSRNQISLHRNPALLPRSARAGASWNYSIPSCDAGAERVVVSYDMNRLMRLGLKVPYVVTLNSDLVDDGRLDSETVISEMIYEHPIYTLKAVAAQKELSSLNTAQIAFAGAYHGWGFHEDGARAGAAAARALGGEW